MTQNLDQLRSKLKHTKHHIRLLENEAVFLDYFESKKEFEFAVDRFFDLDDDELAALYYLGYPLQGRLFFDHEILTKIKQLIPEFLLSLLKIGNSVLFTLYQYQIEEVHEEVEISYQNVLKVSENIFYIWKQISEIEGSSLPEEEKIQLLSELPSVLEFNEHHYDFLGCFQLNLMSQLLYLSLRGVKTGAVNAGLYPDSMKRRLLEEIVGFLALPMIFAEQTEDIDSDFESMMNSLKLKIQNSGFITNVHKALTNSIEYPSLSETVSATHQSDMHEYVFQRNGDVWNIRYQDEFYLFPHMKGFEYIHDILYHFPKPVSPEALTGVVNLSHQFDEGIIVSEVEMDSIHEAEDRESAHHVSQDYSLTSDKKQYKQMQSQVRELMTELEHLSPEDSKHSELVDEINQLNKSISSYYNLYGDPRPSYGGAEQARQSVTKAISRAKKEIAIYMPNLHSHLKNNLKGGYEFRYTLEAHKAPDWLL